MWTGIIDAIYIAAAAKQPTRSIDEVRAIPAVGLEGDRYGLQKGTFSKPIPDCELTLIEAEAIEALQRDYGTQFAAGEARRNLVTRGNTLESRLAAKWVLHSSDLLPTSASVKNDPEPPALRAWSARFAAEWLRGLSKTAMATSAGRSPKEMTLSCMPCRKRRASPV